MRGKLISAHWRFANARMGRVFPATPLERAQALVQQRPSFPENGILKPAVDWLKRSWMTGPAHDALSWLGRSLHQRKGCLGQRKAGVKLTTVNNYRAAIATGTTEIAYP